MIKIQKYAAVDIGSNAVRLLICSVISQNNNIVEVKKISLVRVPIRLGVESFLKNKIKKDNISRLRDVNETFELMLAKNHDYGEAWREMEVISLTDLIIQKLYRMKSILKNDGKTNVSEGIDANFQDILNYSVFAQILLKE